MSATTSCWFLMLGQLLKRFERADSSDDDDEVELAEGAVVVELLETSVPLVETVVALAWPATSAGSTRAVANERTAACTSARQLDASYARSAS